MVQKHILNGFIKQPSDILILTDSIQFLFVTFTCVMPRCCSDTQFLPIKEENETHVEIDVNSKYDNQELFDSIWQKYTKTRDMSGGNTVILDFLDIQFTVVKHKKHSSCAPKDTRITEGTFIDYSRPPRSGNHGFSWAESFLGRNCATLSLINPMQASKVQSLNLKISISILCIWNMHYFKHCHFWFENYKNWK